MLLLFQKKLKLYQMILAIHRLAVPMPNATTVNVLAYRNIMAILILAVDQNVFYTQTVHAIGPVLDINV